MADENFINMLQKTNKMGQHIKDNQTFDLSDAEMDKAAIKANKKFCTLLKIKKTNNKNQMKSKRSTLWTVKFMNLSIQVSRFKTKKLEWKLKSI